MKSREWINRQNKDIYVKKASKLNFVSRSAFKLLEIEKRFSVIKESKNILELGSSPGGWIQSILNIKSDKKFNLICVDIKDLKIKNDSKFNFIKIDFLNPNFENIIKKENQEKFDIILSDMAPNTIGHANTDHLRIIELSKNVIDFSIKFLNKKGFLIFKIWQGTEDKNLVKYLKKYFEKVNYFKPESSRKDSSEIYIICLFFK